MVIPVAVNITRDLALLRAKQPGSNDKIVENDSLRFPKIQIANVGAGSTTQNTLIRYRIVQQPSKTTVFADTLVVSNITPLDTVWLNSLKGFKLSSPGAYVLEAFASIRVDGNPKNDTLRYILLVDQVSNTHSVFVASVVAYPMPTNDNITIDNAEGYQNWKLYDMNGKVVSSGDVKSKQFNINTQPFSSGLYVLKLQGEMGMKSMPIAIAHP